MVITKLALLFNDLEGDNITAVQWADAKDGKKNVLLGLSMSHNGIKMKFHFFSKLQIYF